MEQLSTADQGKVDELNDAIRRLTQENKEAFSARMNLEATKNKLENLLTNNLIRWVFGKISLKYSGVTLIWSSGAT